MVRTKAYFTQRFVPGYVVKAQDFTDWLDSIPFTVDLPAPGAALSASQILALAAIPNKVDQIPGKGLSENDYTIEEKNKLAGLSVLFKGSFASLAALTAAFPTGTGGEYATLIKADAADTRAIWDADAGMWIDSGITAPGGTTLTQPQLDNINAIPNKANINYVDTSLATKLDKNSYYVAETPGAGEISFSAFLTLLPSLPVGTKLYLKRGGTYIGQIDAIKTIEVTAYGSGADPIIAGGENIGAQVWTSEGSNVFSTPMSYEPKWLYQDDVELPWASTPWYTTTAAPSGGNTFTASSIINQWGSSIIGAKFIIREFAWRDSYLFNVTAYNNTTGAVTIDGVPIGGAMGYGFKLYGQRQFIDTNGEWAYVASEQKLYVRAAITPAGTNIVALKHDHNILLSTGVENVRVRSVQLKHAKIAGIQGRDNHDLDVTRCNITRQRGEAIHMRGQAQNINITNNSITNCAFNAISTGALRRAYIGYNTIKNIGVETTVGHPPSNGFWRTGGAAILSAWDTGLPLASNCATNCTIEYNICENLGYTGIQFYGQGHIVQNNVIDGFCKRFTDGGGIYFFNRADLSTLPSSFHIVSKNIVRNGSSPTFLSEGILASEQIFVNGIYFDNGTVSCQADGNTCVDNLTNGIFCNIGTNTNTLTNNLCVGNKVSQIRFSNYTLGTGVNAFTPTVSNIVRSNTMVCKNTTQVCMLLENYNGTAGYNPFSSGGASDQNEYIQPYALSKSGQYFNGTTYTDYSFQGWQALLNQDGNSLGQQAFLTFTNAAAADQEVKLQVNTNNYAQQSPVGKGYADTGLVVITKAVIPAFSGITYFKYTPVPVVVTTPLINDTFTGTQANITTTTPDTVTPPATGTWVVPSGVFERNGSGSMVATATGNVWIETGTANVEIEIVLRAFASGGITVIGRYTSDAQYIGANIVYDTVTPAGNLSNILNRVSGTSTSPNTATVVHNAAVNTDTIFRVRFIGNVITSFVNNVQVNNYTDTSNANIGINNVAGTKFGLRIGAGQVEIKSFKVTAI